MLIQFFVLFFSISLTTGAEENLKFIGGPHDVKSEDIDFVLLRMYKLLEETPSEISALRPLLSKELNSSATYKAAWDEGVQIFKKKAGLLTNAKYPVPDEFHIALITYTIHDTPKANPFYSDFNRRTRELCNGLQIKDAYPYKTFFKLLHLAIPAVGANPKFQNNGTSFYRGGGIGFAVAVGQQLGFQQFISTTASLRKAEEFSGNTTVFEFQGPLPNSIWMVHHSKFPQEEELLVSPMDIYGVEAIVPKKYYNTIVLTVAKNPKSLLKTYPTQ